MVVTVTVRLLNNKIMDKLGIFEYLNSFLKTMKTEMIEWDKVSKTVIFYTIP